MPVELGSVKATEAIANIRSKVGVPTQRWDQWMGAVNAKGFTVAGATKASLVNDFHEAISGAIEDGESIGQFRKRFDNIVQEHGWSYKGKRGWRTRVIYDNNLRTAHMAGRWEQIQRVKDRRPYMIYSTVGDERVRPEHRQWNQTVLPVDHPWWNTHFPPNGWGCRCYVNTASARQLERRGLAVTEAPPANRTERINTATGEVYGEVPQGIDTGWDYNVGKAWLGPDAALGERLVQLPKALRAEVSTSLNNRVVDAAFRTWARRSLATKGTGSVHTIGWLDHRVITALEERGTAPATAAISITDHRLRRMLRDSKKDKGITLPEEDVLNLPRLLRDARAVLQDSKGGLVYVLDDTASGRTGKAIIYVNFRQRGELTNSVRSAGTDTLRALRNKGIYELLVGDL